MEYTFFYKKDSFTCINGRICSFCGTIKTRLREEDIYYFFEQTNLLSGCREGYCFKCPCGRRYLEIDNFIPGVVRDRILERSDNLVKCRFCANTNRITSVADYNPPFFFCCFREDKILDCSHCRRRTFFSKEDLPIRVIDVLNRKNCITKRAI